MIINMMYNNYVFQTGVQSLSDSQALVEHVYVNVMNYIWSINLSRTDFKHPLKNDVETTWLKFSEKVSQKTEVSSEKARASFVGSWFDMLCLMQRNSCIFKGIVHPKMNIL